MPPVGLEASALRDLPLEVLLRITEFLPTTDLGAFRLSCRAIERFLDSSFISEFFTRKQFMFSVFSLSTLVDISQSRLGPRLQFLHIGLDRISQMEARPPPPPPGDTRQEAIKKWERLNDLRAEHAGARATGEYHALLATALSNLPNLEGIMIRDFNSRRRTRDGYNSQWRSYGHQTIENTTGFRPTFPRGNYGSPEAFPSATDAFIQVLSACAHAGARPKAIEIMTQNIEATDEAFRLPSSSSKRRLFMPVVEGLQKLHIHYQPRPRPDGGPALPDLASSVNNGPDNNGPDNNGPNNNAFDTIKPFGSSEYDHFLHRFLCEAVNLTDLRINQSQHNFNPGFAHGGARSDNPSQYLLNWLAAAAAAASPSSGPFLPKLKHLSIGRSDLEVSVLSKVVKAFADRLESLEMHRITLYKRLPQPGHGEKLPKTNLWVALLKELRRIELNKLHHVKFAMMNQAYLVASHMWPKCKVTLEGKALQGLDYTGTDWRQYLDEQEDQISVTWSEIYETTASMLSESEDDSEGDSDIEM